MEIALVTDSTADLPPEQVAKARARVVPLYVHLGGKTYRDGVEITAREVIEAMKEGADPPTTSQPTPEDFKAVYAEALKEADRVISIHISSKLSGTVQSARMAAEAFPGKVEVFDTLLASAGVGALVLFARELLDQGLNFWEVLEKLLRARERSILRFTVASLEFLKKNGRIGGAQALVGSLLKIKPILTLKEGRVEPAGKARGEKKALAEMIKAYADWKIGKVRPRIAYLYAADVKAVEPMKARILELGLSAREVYTGELGAVISSHVGPGTYGYFAFDSGV